MKQNIDRLLKALWIKSCRYDNIPVNSKFVVFSVGNPHQARYNKFMNWRLCGCVSEGK